MACKTRRMPDGCGFESAFFQPKCFAGSGRWLGYIFIGRIAGWLIGRVTDVAAFFPFSRLVRWRAFNADYLDMFVVWKCYREIRIRSLLSLGRSVEQLAWIRERVSRIVSWPRIRVANSADRGRPAFEKLLFMTSNT